MPLTPSDPSPCRWRAAPSSSLAEFDLAGLIASGVVTAVEFVGDGTVRLACTADLPGEVEDRLLPGDETLEDRIARLEGGLRGLSDSLLARERLVDRLDAVEFGLSERLQGMIAQELIDFAADEPPRGPDRLAGIEATLSDLPAQLERLSDRMTALEARGEANTTRPGLAQVITALGQVLRRIESVADRLAAGPDLSALPAPDLAPLQADLAEIRAEIRDLAARPAPLPDLVAQRQSLSHFAVAMKTALQRLEAATDRLAPDAILQRLDRIDQNLGALPDPSGGAAPGPDLSGVEAALSALATRMEAHQTRPAEPDAQLRGLATLDGAMMTLMERVESIIAALPVSGQLAELEAKIDALADSRRDALAEAILTLAERGLASPGLASLQSAQKEFFQDLRFLLAEIVARQVQAAAV